ncbi:hypothetical protein ACHAWO_011844 [Cyclotella atomus]|uniref:Uncharacterized protein n=1 Tax=Cyclotella atomus TaxID=382360 RepID=A0ABD3PLR9_9STRA
MAIVTARAKTEAKIIAPIGRRSDRNDGYRCQDDRQAPRRDDDRNRDRRQGKHGRHQKGSGAHKGNNRRNDEAMHVYDRSEASSHSAASRHSASSRSNSHMSTSSHGSRSAASPGKAYHVDERKPVAKPPVNEVAFNMSDGKDSRHPSPPKHSSKAGSWAAPFLKRNLKKKDHH